MAILVCLSGCGNGSGGFGPGLTDFHAKLPHGYELWQTSSHQVKIYSSTGTYSEAGLPPKVVSLGLDDQFILAQQQWLDAKDDPIPSKYQYWIIDAPAQKRYGPFTEKEFNAKRKELGVPDEIKLKGKDSYRP